MKRNTEVGFPLPKWVLEGKTPSERKELRSTFLVKLASLYHDGRASQGGIARAIGYSDTSIRWQISETGRVSLKQCLAIEKLLGRHLFPRELLRPDLFLIPEQTAEHAFVQTPAKVDKATKNGKVKPANAKP